jgi:hypothetical protein
LTEEIERVRESKTDREEKKRGEERDRTRTEGEKTERNIDDEEDEGNSVRTDRDSRYPAPNRKRGTKRQKKRRKDQSEIPEGGTQPACKCETRTDPILKTTS